MNIKKLLLSALISLSISLIAILFFNICYSSNDSALMQIISSGDLTGIPSPYLFLSSSIIGYVLNLLYTIEQNINFYFLYVIFNYFLFFSLYIYLLMLQKLDWRKILISISIFILSLLIIQYTTISLLLILNSFLYLELFLNSRKKIYLIVGFCLLIYAGLIRYESIYVFLIVLFPFLLYKSYKTKRFILLVWLFFGVTSSFAIRYWENHKQSELLGYNVLKYVKATEAIIDNPNSINKQDLINNNIDSTFLFMLQSFFFLDTQLFNYEKITNLSSDKMHYRNFVEIKDIIYNTIKSLYIYIIILLFLLLVSKIYKTERLILLFYLLLSIFLIVFVRFTYHLSLAIILSIIYLVIYKSFIKYNKILYIFIIIYFILGIKYFIDISLINKNKREKLELVLKYFEKNENLTYQLTIFSDIGVEALAKPKRILKDHPKNFLLYGWLFGTVVEKSYVENKLENGRLINKNPFLSIIEDENTMIISNEFYNNILSKFTSNYYDKEIYFEQIDTIADLEIYKIISIDSNDIQIQDSTFTVDANF